MFSKILLFINKCHIKSLKNQEPKLGSKSLIPVKDGRAQAIPKPVISTRRALP